MNPLPADGAGRDAAEAPGAMAPRVDRLLAEIAALRQTGAHRLDPTRFHYLEALARRLGAAPPAVQRILAARLAQDLAAYGAAPDGPSRRASPNAVFLAGPDVSRSPLAELTRYLNEARQAAADPAARGLEARWGSTPAAATELASVHRFRETWSRLAAEAQVDHAVGRGPENAGPLNSHMLVLRTLALMRELSPDYLRRFLSQTDALLWLEQAQARPKAAPPKARAARPPRQKKPAA